MTFLMGTECIGARLGETDIIPSVPPGFESLAVLTLQRVQENALKARESDLATQCTSDSPQTPPNAVESTSNGGRLKKSLRHRPWINYSEFDNGSEEEESDSESIEPDTPAIKYLPKGVLRGCLECRNCQKVTAQWRPEDACRPVLDEAPVFYPTEEEFIDTLKYIASIRPMAEPYGICRIVPPSSWSPPCTLNQKDVYENSKFSTRVQKVHKLQNRDSCNKTCKSGSPMKRKRRKILETGAECRNSYENIVEANIYGHHNNADKFGFEPGPDFTLESFEKYANDFKKQYFQTKDNVGLMPRQSEPLPENVEGEYWRIVEHPTEEIEVLYGADLETGKFGSGFPRASLVTQSYDLEDRYVKSGWNLNNFPRLPGSVLSFESEDISGVLVPWLYIGMCFSSFCWHVEDHHLYSLNYLHCGAPKMWYGVPGRDALKLEAAMKKHLPDLFEEQPDLLHNLVTQFSPALLKREGVPVYRSVQHEGEFVLTFPRAYHSGFNCGFNCAEAVNVAPLDWLPHGQNAVELYREQAHKISLSHDKLLLGAAREAVRAQWNISFLRKNTIENLGWKEACGVDRILAKSLKDRVDMEQLRREILGSSKSRKMDVHFDFNCERECVFCHYDLHLSAVGCICSPDRFACLAHAKELCSCDWSTRIFLFRYEINELNILVEALGGKLSAVHKWGLCDLGLNLTSVVTKERTPESKKSPNKLTLLETRVQKDKGSPSHSNFGGGSKNNSSIQEIKASILQKSCYKESILNHEGSQPFPSEKVQEEPVENRETLARLNSTDEIATFYSPHDIKASFSGEGGNTLQHAVKKISSIDKPASIELSYQRKEGPNLINQCPESSFPKNPPYCENSTSEPVAKPSPKFSDIKQEVGCSATSDQRQLKHVEVLRSASTNKEAKGGKFGLTSSDELIDASITVSSFCPQKGPQLAKVVRRFNYNVELLECGTVLSGKLWSTSQAIFPKGYRSRVRYFSVLYPTQMCYYVSEILDAGLLGPLFMVKVEKCPSEVFIHTSATKCWDMVRERLNNEIKRHQNSGKVNVPTLQPPGSLDGLEMFGLTLPTIIQAIEAIDRQRCCTEYWRSRSQLPSPSSSMSSLRDQGNIAGASMVIKGLLEKGNAEELQALHRLLSSDDDSKCEKELIGLLEDVIAMKLR